MSSMSHDSNTYRKHVCYCGIESPLVTSWSVSNPGRRFFGCSNYGKPNACHFFNWFDPPLQPEATSIILGLLRKIDRIEREKERALEREREMEREMARKNTWNNFIFISVLVVVVFLGIIMM